MKSESVPSPEQRVQALREVLESQTFARSDQLKRFLRHVCELAIAGRSGEIKEYSIGVDALGRPPSYSPATDSSVRRRAFELRSKLEEVYAGELASSEVLIELPKGSYVPVFRFRRNEDDDRARPRKVRLAAAVGVALVAGALLGALGITLMTRADPRLAPSAIVRDAWGPLATPGSTVLICVGTSLHLSVRAGGFAPDSTSPSFPVPPEIARLYEKLNPWPDRGTLYMRPASNTTTLGVAGAVAQAASTLRTLGVRYQILPERSAPLASFRNRNVILLGDPLHSLAAAKLLTRGRLSIALDPTTNRLVIRDRRKSATSPPAFARSVGRAGDAAEVYGLLTVLPSDSEPGQQRRTMIVSGVSHVGIQGAMEFFTSPESLAELRSRFRREGLPDFPPAYQLVVRCTADDSLPLSCGYAAHEVLEP